MFRLEDYLAIINHAFNTDNIALWLYFIPYNPPLNPKIDDVKQLLRAYTREQSKEKRKFHEAWAKHNRNRKELCKHIRKDGRMRKSRSEKELERSQRSAIAESQNHFDQNIERIKSGNDWHWLLVFAKGHLSNSTEGYPYFEDENLPDKALQNCFSFLKEQASSIGFITDEVATVLQVACLIQFRNKGHLSGIDLDFLKVVKMNSSISFIESEASDNEAFNHEVNRHLFKTEKDIEQFVREFIEPQLENSEAQYTDVDWLQNRKEFSFLLGRLSLEWLEHFPDMDQNSLSTLFDNVARHGDPVQFKKIIRTKVAEIGVPPEEADLLVKYNERRDFWFLRQLFFIDEICSESRDWLSESETRIFELEAIIGEFRSKSVWPPLSAEKIYLALDLFVEPWPKTSLLHTWWFGRRNKETAYRFLKDIIWGVKQDKPDNAIPVLEEILKQDKFSDYHNDAKHLLFTAQKKRVLLSYTVPSPNAIVELLENLKIASVEDLRAFLIEALDSVQQWVRGGETDGRSYFYEGSSRVNENKATKRIVNQLQLKSEALGLPITIEHQLADNKRCDFTVRSNVDGIEKMLVVEVKGQWHKALYTAAAEQLNRLYSIHPSAEGQGIFLVLWFGEDEKIAGRKDESISTPEQLKDKVIKQMPSELHGLIDVVVLDLA